MGVRIGGRDCLEVLVDRIPLGPAEGGPIDVVVRDDAMLVLRQSGEGENQFDVILVPTRVVPFLQKAMLDGMAVANTLKEQA